MPYSKSTSAGLSDEGEAGIDDVAGRLPGWPSGWHRGNTRPGADRRLDVAFGQQLLIDVDDRAACDAEELGETSSRRQALAGADPFLPNRRPQLILDLNP